jgi:hypothetical protein
MFRVISLDMVQFYSTIDKLVNSRLTNFFVRSHSACAAPSCRTLTHFLAEDGAIESRKNMLLYNGLREVRHDAASHFALSHFHVRSATWNSMNASSTGATLSA